MEELKIQALAFQARTCATAEPREAPLFPPFPPVQYLPVNGARASRVHLAAPDQESAASRTMAGCLAAILSNVRAAPLGWMVPHKGIIYGSQSCLLGSSLINASTNSWTQVDGFRVGVPANSFS